MGDKEVGMNQQGKLKAPNGSVQGEACFEKVINWKMQSRKGLLLPKMHRQERPQKSTKLGQLKDHRNSRFCRRDAGAYPPFSTSNGAAFWTNKHQQAAENEPESRVHELRIRKGTVRGRGDGDDDDEGNLTLSPLIIFFDSISAAAAIPSAAGNSLSPSSRFDKRTIQPKYKYGSTKKFATEPAGKLKPPTMDLSSGEAFSTEKVINCENAVQKRDCCCPKCVLDSGRLWIIFIELLNTCRNLILPLLYSSRKNLDNWNHGTFYELFVSMNHSHDHREVAIAVEVQLIWIRSMYPAPNQFQQYC
nr:hypothetical protein Iba_chr14eCG8590 [Ipomoea batatas]